LFDLLARTGAHLRNYASLYINDLQQVFRIEWKRMAFFHLSVIIIDYQSGRPAGWSLWPAQAKAWSLKLIWYNLWHYCCRNLCRNLCHNCCHSLCQNLWHYCCHKLSQNLWNYCCYNLCRNHCLSIIQANKLAWAFGQPRPDPFLSLHHMSSTVWCPCCAFCRPSSTLSSFCWWFANF